jgi:predicted unusual protein kinase regulating ubiquinone biosynthesis (AarF/ABC1/UbiB family)
MGKSSNTVKRIKTGKFERRMSIAGASMLAGTRAATHLCANALTPKDKRLEKRREMIAEQAHYLADELGKLKGSVVKIGQMMALYGEHILPPEVTTAFRRLEEQTTAVDWPVMEQVLQQQLGPERLAQLDIEPEALAAASLGQVHRARRKSDGRQLCLKIQYPGVAEAIDSDLDAVATLLRWKKIIRQGNDFDCWLDEIRSMLKREVDYVLEAATTAHFGSLLAEDPRFVVPGIFNDFCTEKVITMSFEPGYVVNSSAVAKLPQRRRNALGEAFLELFFREFFEWSELQTDPNFGNYRIQPRTTNADIDKIVLLDFGAVKKFPASFIAPVKAMVTGAYRHNTAQIIEGATALNIMKPRYPEEVLTSFAKLCLGLIEPLNYNPDELPACALNKQQAYRWAHSNLPRRMAKQAAQSACSKYFAIPPGEFTFLSKKLLGVYTFIAALDAEIDGREALAARL